MILKNVQRDVENSLRRFQTDYIDIYQLHEGRYDKNLALELHVILEELVSAGKIRWYGWSTYVVENARSFASSANSAHCTSIQFRLNALYDNAAMRQVCARFNLAGINKDPLNKGFLTGKFNESTTFPDNDVRQGTDFSSPEIVKRLKIVDEIRDILTSNGRTMAQGALAYIWALDARMVPIPGFKSVKQVEENAGGHHLVPLLRATVEGTRRSIGKFLKTQDVVLIEVFLQDTPEMVERYLAGKNFPMVHKVLIDDMQVYKGYGIYTIPRFLVVDKERKVRYDNGNAATILPAAEIKKLIEAAGT